MKPCPNPECRSDVVFESDSGYEPKIYCPSCGMNGPKSDIDSHEEAVRLWNLLPRVAEETESIEERWDSPNYPTHLDAVWIGDGVSNVKINGKPLTKNQVAIETPRDVDRWNEYLARQKNYCPDLTVQTWPVAMNQQINADKWNEYWKRANGYKVVDKKVTLPNASSKPVDKNKWPHTCNCGAPAYLAGPGYSECSNPDCEEYR